MTAVDPTKVAIMDAAAWNSADISEISDDTTCATDNNLVVQCNNKVGKSPDDVLRIEFPDLSTIAVGDTVTIQQIGYHNVATLALLPYDGASSVLTTNKITFTTGSTPEAAVFTLTQAFIDDLFDQGSGTWACRLTEDNGLSGDYKYSEVDGDLTTGVAGVEPEQVSVIG